MTRQCACGCGASFETASPNRKYATESCIRRARNAAERENRRRLCINTEIKTRRCINCGVDFESTHAGHRMCDECKASPAPLVRAALVRGEVYDPAVDNADDEVSNSLDAVEQDDWKDCDLREEREVEKFFAHRERE